MVWNTTLLCIVPPYNGCGWQTSAAWVALALPEFSNASKRPTGPSRKSERIVPDGETMNGEYIRRFPHNFAQRSFVACFVSGHAFRRHKPYFLKLDGMAEGDAVLQRSLP
jgi:hypothetical protein